MPQGKGTKITMPTSLTLGLYFTNNAKKVILNAAKISVLTGRKTVGVRQLLAALFITPETSASIILLKRLRFDVDKEIASLLNRKFDRLLTQLDSINEKQIENILLANDTKEVLLEASRLASKIGSHYLGTEHILISILVWGEVYKSSLIKPYLERIGSLDSFISSILSITQIPFKRKETGTQESFLTDLSTPIGLGEGQQGNYLQRFAYDVRNWFFENTIGVLYDRKEYVEEVIKGLINPVGRSVLLVGPSGVGKTYIVYSVADHLAKLDVPVGLSGAKILAVNIPKIIASAKFPSDVEKSIMGVLAESRAVDKAVLFFDDFQYIIGSVVRGGMNMRASLKKLIESRQLRFVATISDLDFEALVERDPEFIRLFKVVRVEEPEEYEVMEMLKLYVKKFTSMFPLKVNKDALLTLINLAGEYLSGMYFPDKAVRVFGAIISEKLFARQVKFKGLGLLEKRIAEVESAKERLIDIGQYEQARKAKDIQEELNEKLKQATEKLELESRKQIRISVKDVRAQIAKITGIPVETLSSDETSMLLHLEDKLKEYIVSQEEAIKKVAYAVKRGRLGIVSRNRPWASFLFLGPTGVGKTELAKALARILFGDSKENLIQIDMSELMESHSVSKLIGAPPGYVGYQQGGMLTNRVKENPYSVVLFDEIEKASDEVLNILLQILEEGHLTDSRGETVSFSNTIVVLTSNIGAEKIFEDRVLGFYREQVSKEDLGNAYESMREELFSELRKRIRPELLNRLDDIIIFRTLTKKDSEKILEILLRELNLRLERIGVRVQLTPKAKRLLLDKGFNQEYGARPLRREVQQGVENLLADYLLQNQELYKTLKATKPKVFEIDCKNKRLQIKSVK